MHHRLVVAGEGRFAVTLEATSTDGQGISCFLYGGTLPHVGGCALAAPCTEGNSRGRICGP